jgi:Domain of unknown function (DUF4406)
MTAPTLRRSMKRVYVAGAYSSDNVIGAFDNIRKGLRWSTQVFLSGHAPFCPWTDFHYQLMLRDGEKLTLHDYYEQALAWLRVAEVVFATPGWESSRGAHAEVELAKELGIPVVYRLEDIRARLGLGEGEPK